jgi:heme O synthase-like polyprenyltransferase
MAVELSRAPSTARAMRLFGFSITYLVVLFAAMAADQLIRSGL